MRSHAVSHCFVPVLLAAVLAAGSASSSFAQAGPRADQRPGFVPGELIVLLDHGPAAPTPEAVVESAREGHPLPGGLGTASPIAARFMISDRRSGAAGEQDPESPQAILQRYLVLTYPSVANLDQVAEALEAHPDVLWAGKNSYAGLSIEPNDTFFNDNPGGVTRPPEEHQWGSYSLQLPTAWNWNRGHAYVGVVDTGIDTDHPDLRPFNASGSYVGGNFRAHMSRDYGYDDDNVDEGQQQGTAIVKYAGHGTHVAGIVGATANNSIGVAGSCWNCSLIVAKVSRITSGGANGATSKADVVDGINGAIRRGSQILNLSLGWEPGDPKRADCAADPYDPICSALSFMENRDIVMAAAAGNNGNGQASDWPAADSRVIGVGGIAPDGSFWDDCSSTSTFECGSNVDPNQLVAPAKVIYSTFYEGLPYSPDHGCSDKRTGTNDVVDGYGLCTGTSMSSPYIAGSAGVVRSANPLLSKGNVFSILSTNLQNPTGWSSANGIGKPHVRNAVLSALGRVNAAWLKNRLTPLFQLYSSTSEDYYYTTVPQQAAAETQGSDYYRPSGPDVPGYGRFPGGNCPFVPCDAAASVYVFTTFRSPNTHPLVPLYRMSYEGDFNGTNPDNRDHTYTTEAAGIEAFRNVGYRLDGIEGYIYQRCSSEPSCIPAGAVRLYRYYNATRDDWAVFPESELTTWTSQGYSAQSGANPWIGYVYPNVDTDGDWLINGFETLVGTNPSAADSDCDGKTDGAELLQYPYTDPEVGSC